MIGRIARRAGNGDSREAGMTLIELLVSMILLGIVGSIALSAVVATQRAANASRQVNDVNEEARLVLNRMTRELREANNIVAVSNVLGPGYNVANPVSITFEADFNGNGVIDALGSDPERITYYYDPNLQQLQIRADGQTAPILAANVGNFTLDLTSTRYQYDGTSSASGGVCGTQSAAAKDGIVTWSEVDGNATKIDGNCNGILDKELPAMSSVAINFTVLYGSKTQQYSTQVDLRNAS